MNGYLLDTCVLLEYVKRSPERRVIDWLDRLPESTLHISALTLGELVRGAAKLEPTDPDRAGRLAAWIALVETRFGDRVLPWDGPVARHWGVAHGRAESSGAKPPLLDSLILAVARRHRLTLVTRNTGDFAGYEAVFDPWRG